MNVLNVNSTIGTQLGGGTAERTFQLSKYIANQPYMNCQILVHDIDLDPVRVRGCNPAIVIPIFTIWNRFYIPLFFVGKVYRAVKKADVIHLMGHWTILNVIVYVLARYCKKPYVFCPAGALPLFGRSITLKKIYNLVIGRAIVKNANIHIAITQKEVSDFLEYGVEASKIQIIPNGIDCSRKTATREILPKNKLLSQLKIPVEAEYVLFMGRLNPIKGPDILLEAFEKIKSQIPGFHLIYCGSDGGILKNLMKRSIELDISDFVHFVGHVDGDVKASFYEHASLLVVPSRQEAMSIVALEAGLYKTPALVSCECGLSEIKLIDKSLETHADVDSLGSQLLCLLSDVAMLAKFGLAWHEYVIRNYDWESIVQIHLKLFARLVNSNK